MSKYFFFPNNFTYSRHIHFDIVFGTQLYVTKLEQVKGISWADHSGRAV
jgi:hypothetical protein